MKLEDSDLVIGSIVFLKSKRSTPPFDFKYQKAEVNDINEAVKAVRLRITTGGKNIKVKHEWHPLSALVRQEPKEEAA